MGVFIDLIELEVFAKLVWLQPQLSDHANKCRVMRGLPQLRRINKTQELQAAAPLAAGEDDDFAAASEW